MHVMSMEKSMRHTVVARSRDLARKIVVGFESQPREFLREVVQSASAGLAAASVFSLTSRVLTFREWSSHQAMNEP